MKMLNKNCYIKDKYQNLIALCLILGLGILFQYQYIADYPNHIHAWSQTDRYALALGFLNNDFNLFYPETYMQNHWFEKVYPFSITAVDFPIHEYIIAGFMKLFGTTSPWIFRIYTLIYSFFGLFFLFKLSRLLTSDFLKSLLVIICIATSPAFAYYQGGFLPTIPSLCNVFIGLYFYISYIQKNKQYRFSLALLFLTLAALNRTSFLIPIIAVLSFEFVRIFRKETSFVPKILPVIISLAAIIGYFLWNMHLRQEYASVFLAVLAYPNTYEEAKSILSSINWTYHYFSNIHYIIFIISAFAGLFFCAWRYWKRKQTDKKKHLLSLWIFTAIWLTGCLLFFIAMMRQFINHDYYFLDSFFPLIVFIFILFLSKIPLSQNKWIALGSFILLICLSIPMVTKVHKKQQERRNASFDPTIETIYCFEGSAAFLDSLGIDKSAKILVLDTYPPNMAFIFMKRKGYYVPVWDNIEDRIEKHFQWNYDYIVVPNHFFIYNYQRYPQYYSHIDGIADNGKITIAKYSQIPKPFSFTQITENKNIIFHKTINFDTIFADNWKNVQLSDSIFYSGSNAGVLKTGNQWGVSYRTKDTELFSTSERKVLFSGYFFEEGQENMSVTLCIKTNSKEIYQKTFSITDIIAQTDDWKKVVLLFPVPKLPQSKTENYEFVLHVSSPDECKNNVYYDDMEIIIY